MKLFLRYSYSLLLIISALCIFTPRVHAATYYVSNTGADTNTGSLASPWKTLVYAATKLAPGDTLMIRAGIYKERVTFAKSGTSSQPIKIMSYTGETAVVDGNYEIPPAAYSALLVFSGSYQQVDGLEVRNSFGQGIEISGANITLSHIVSHDNLDHGIIAWQSSDAIVQDSTIYNNAKSLEDGIHHFGRTNYSTGLSAAVGADKTILRRNKIYNNWGEGLSTFNATNTIMEDNIVYDNSKNVYLSDTAGMLVQRNLVYCTPGNKWRLSSIVTQHGINFQDEEQKPESDNVTVINNVVVGCVTNFKWYPFTSNSSMKNVLIANNVFVNATGTTSDAAFTIAAAKDIVHSNRRIINNIIEQDDSKTIGSFAAPNEGIIFSNNIWSKAPPSNMMGTNSLVTDPKLAKTGSITPGSLTAEYFTLTASSPAIDKGANLTEVNSDFFKATRPIGVAFDIGAHEYKAGAITPTNPPSATLVPSVTTIPSPTTTPQPGGCLKKNIGDADCAADTHGIAVNILDYTIWYSEFIHNCSSTNLSGCGADNDHDGNPMDANFNYPGTNYISTDNKVDSFDYAVWIQGFIVSNP